MGKTLLFFTLIIIIPLTLSGQKIDNIASFRQITSDSYFRFNYENDYFNATDRDYTQGYSFELVTPWLAKNPANHLLVKVPDSKYQYGVAIEHIGFTPYRYVSDEIQYGDRPFASAIMLKSFVIAADTIHKSRFSSALSIGLIGPGAFGGEMQTEIHRATGNKIPEGWRHQIRNDLVLNYEVNYEKRLLRYRNNLSVQATGKLRIGTLNTNASAGLAVMLGVFSTDYNPNKNDRKYQLYLYSQPLLSVVGYDATLQGGFFNRKSPYTISSSAIERFTLQHNYGLILQTRTMYFEYSRSAITREFNTGRAAGWGGVKIGFRF
ncbi:MAG TPA: lipid A deacylase LpxR family protein [Flavobacterium sp.]|jgi:hypothetical protein